MKYIQDIFFFFSSFLFFLVFLVGAPFLDDFTWGWGNGWVIEKILGSLA
jgi:hypothetical protein